MFCKKRTPLFYAPQDVLSTAATTFRPTYPQPPASFGWLRTGFAAQPPACHSEAQPKNLACDLKLPSDLRAGVERNVLFDAQMLRGVNPRAQRRTQHDKRVEMLRGVYPRAQRRTQHDSLIVLTNAKLTGCTRPLIRPARAWRRPSYSGRSRRAWAISLLGNCRRRRARLARGLRRRILPGRRE